MQGIAGGVNSATQWSTRSCSRHAAAATPQSKHASKRTARMLSRIACMRRVRGSCVRFGAAFTQTPAVSSSPMPPAETRAPSSPPESLGSNAHLLHMRHWPPHPPMQPPPPPPWSLSWQAAGQTGTPPLPHPSPPPPIPPPWPPRPPPSPYPESPPPPMPSVTPPGPPSPPPPPRSPPPYQARSGPLDAGPCHMCCNASRPGAPLPAHVVSSRLGIFGRSTPEPCVLERPTRRATGTGPRTVL